MSRRHGIRISTEQIAEYRRKAAVAHQKLTARHFTYEMAWDWRAVAGTDWTVNVQDQQSCGSCTAFATTGAGAIQEKIDANNPNLQPHFSEWFLFEHGGGNCKDGADIEEMAQTLVDSGTPDYDCLPYNPTSPPSCCPDFLNRLNKATSKTVFHTAAEAKGWINAHGPMTTGMGVPDSMMTYSGGIYSPDPSEPYDGYHCICVIGYDDVGQFWIIRNSWGLGWGEKGYFRVAYGKCGIGTDFPFVGFTEVAKCQK